MKQIFSALLITALSLSSFAQQHRTCFSVEATNKLRSVNPAYNQGLIEQEQSLIKQLATGQQDEYFSARAVRTIPVVVHVIYKSSIPAQNVSTTLITQTIAQLNADFRKLNSDFNTARAAVQAVAADPQIEFCLATIDPNGATTTGIRRVTTTKSCFDSNTETDDMKYASSGGDNAWDPTKYLNIWIVSICGSSPQTGGIGGYAYLAAQGNGLHGQDYDGLVIDYSIGLGTGNRTATHEIGHYMGLHHIWGDNSSNACGSTFPTLDDGFSDTPDSKEANFGCSYVTSCSGNSAYGDQIENYMDYSDCTVMFTTQQANYMNTILTNVRSSLVTNNNRCTTTGAPTASFTANPTSICTGQTVSFTNTSTGSGNTYLWTFTGGTPSSSTATNPTVTYNTAGTYTVSLQATNSNGNNTSTQTNLITVAGANTLPLSEAFTGATFPPTGWSLLNSDQSVTWVRTTSAGNGSPTASAYVNNYSYSSTGQQDWLITPSYNFTGVTNGRIKWDYSYAPYTQAGYVDSLEVLYSLNCGTTWTSLWKKGGTALGTATATGNNFTPTSSSQWKTDSASLTSLNGQANVRFAFKNVNDYGNNIFLDNVNVFNASAQQGSAPVADFIGTPTTIVAGNAVTFTDLSTNAPTAWNWTTTGGTPASSTSQYPSITYNTPGSYSVTLTSSNGNGASSPVTKTNYITVLQQGGGSTNCDTLSNLFTTDTLTAYLVPGATGYLSGNNAYADKAKAEYFVNSTTAQVTGGWLYFALAKSLLPATNTCLATVWNANGTNGSPGTVLATQPITISSIITDVTNQDPTSVTFSSPPTVTGNFYFGIQLPTIAGDTVVLFTSTVNSPNPDYGWEQWSDNTWHSYDSSYGVGLDNVVFPFLCTSSGQAPTASFTGTPTSVCAGASVAFTSTSTGSPTSHSWTFTGGSPAGSSLQNPTVTYNTPGTYAVSLTVSNANGNNTSTQNAFITVNAKPTLGTSSNPVLCYNGSTGSASVTATGGNTFTYSWSGGGSSASITGKPAGTYTVTVTNNFGCSATASVSITQPLAALTLTANPSDAVCGQSNGTASVTATGGAGGYTYLWNTGGNTQTLNNVAAGNYSVTVLDANQCSAVTVMTINNSTSNLSVTVQGTNASCGLQNGSAAAIANSPNFNGTYSWSNGGNAGTISGLAPGTYTVTITASNGCTASASATITNVASTMNVTFTSTPSACGQSTGSITANVTGGNGGYTYNWSGGGTTQGISNKPAGSYTITITDNSNCSVTFVGTISNANGPVVTINSTAPSCFNGTNGSATSTISGGTQPYTYSWSSGSSNSSASNLAGGNTYVLTVTDAAQCLAVQSVTISNPAQLNVSVTSSNALCGQPNGTATAIVTGGTGAYSYTWNTGSVAQNIAALAAGTYHVTAHDANQCSATASATITNTVAPASVINPINGTCQVSPQVNLTVTGGQVPYTFAWSNGATTEDLSNINAGSYSVTITDANGCINVNNTSVTDASSISVSFTSTNPTQGNSDGSITANGTGGTQPYTYVWNNGAQTQTISNLPAGTYTVTITDNTGCTKVSSTTIATPTGMLDIEASMVVKLYPNPAKEVCYVQIESSKEQTLEINLYNNLGQLVFNDKQNNFKQGIQTIDVNTLAPGVYIVRVQLDGNSKTLRFIKQ